jgi:hypothetical protein
MDSMAFLPNHYIYYYSISSMKKDVHISITIMPLMRMPNVQNLQIPPLYRIAKHVVIQIRWSLEKALDIAVSFRLLPEFGLMVIVLSPSSSLPLMALPAGGEACVGSFSELAGPHPRSSNIAIWIPPITPQSNDQLRGLVISRR